MKRGLVLGTFAPLHAGHQLLIETALAETDEVVVVIYDEPVVTNVPLYVRARWITRLYPAVRLIEAWDRPLSAGTEIESTPSEIEYLIGLLGDIEITHFYSSESYGDDVSAALGAIHRCVDPDRRIVPVSGTAVRQNAFSMRRYLPSIVYRDLIVSVVFLGAPSTGKTLLASTLAVEYGTEWMPEFGREYWEEHHDDRRLSPEQLVDIAEGHLDREDSLILDANRYFFVDTDATTTAMFALYYHGSVHPRLEQLASEARSRYDVFFVCADDIPYEDTWERSGETYRRVFQKQTIADLQARKIPFVTLAGTVDERLARVRQVLTGYRKYSALGDWLLDRK